MSWSIQAQIHFKPTYGGKRWGLHAGRCSHGTAYQVRWVLNGWHSFIVFRPRPWMEPRDKPPVDWDSIRRAVAGLTEKHPEMMKSTYAEKEEDGI